MTEHFTEPDEPFGRQEFGQIITTLGSNEIRGLVYGAMEPGKLYSPPRIGHLYNGLSGRPPVWEQQDINIYKYIEYLLNRFVAREPIPGVKPGGLRRIEQAAEYIGLATVGQMLHFSLDEETPALSELFKSQVETDFTATRIDILAAVAGHELPMRANHPALPNHHPRAFQALHEAGMLLYRPRTSNYLREIRPIPDALQAYTPTTQLDQLLKAILLEQGAQNPDSTCTTGELVDRLERIATDQDVRFEDLTPRINFMANRGVVELYKNPKATVDADTQQQAIIQRLATVLRGLQQKDPDTLAEGKQYARDITSKPGSESVRFLIDKVRTGSRDAQAAETPARTQQIAGALQSLGGSGSLLDIKQRLAEDGITLSAAHIRRVVTKSGASFDVVNKQNHLRVRVADKSR